MEKKLDMPIDVAFILFSTIQLVVLIDLYRVRSTMTHTLDHVGLLVLLFLYIYVPNTRRSFAF